MAAGIGAIVAGRLSPFNRSVKNENDPWGGPFDPIGDFRSLRRAMANQAGYDPIRFSFRQDQIDLFRHHGFIEESNEQFFSAYEPIA